MTLADDLAYTTASDLALRIRRRDLSPVEVVNASIERIEARNPSLNAFVYYGFDEARSRAQAAERALMAGEPLGPLHGVPSAIKDLFNFKPGWKATFGGVRALKDFSLDMSSLHVERMERAGAIILGMTNSPVMGFRGVCDNYLFGPSRNPFNTAKNTGGSSGGSAGAVADGMVPLAQGTDGGGSIRIPASWCGIYGYKASYGRVPQVIRPDAFASLSPFIFDGTLTRTVEDAALMLGALAGYDPRDPMSLGDEVDFLGATRRGVRGMRIAYTPDYGIFPVDPRVAETVRVAVRAFEEAGAHVEEVKVDIKRSQQELSDLWCRLIMPLSVVVFENFKANGLDLLKDHRDDFPPQFLSWLERGYSYSVLDMARDQAMRTEVYDAVQGVLNQYDLLISPTLAALPVDNGSDGNTIGPTQINGEAIDPLIGWCITYLINYSGHPAASIPAGLADGLPVGMQIVGRRYADADVLAASAAFERLRPWYASYAICAGRTL